MQIYLSQNFSEPWISHCDFPGRDILFFLFYKIIQCMEKLQAHNELLHIRYLDIPLFIYFFWPGHAACGTSVPLTRDWACAPTVEAWSLNHWAAREVPLDVFIVSIFLHFLNSVFLSLSVNLSLSLKYIYMYICIHKHTHLCISSLYT